MSSVLWKEDSLAPIIVEGGSDNKATSEFNGPVIFNEKVTSLSTKGVEMDSLFLQGSATVSRKYTVGISTPTQAGNPGDIVFQARPTKGGNSGWIYTTDNDWYRFGTISLSLLDQGLSVSMMVLVSAPHHQTLLAEQRSNCLSDLEALSSLLMM